MPQELEVLPVSAVRYLQPPVLRYPLQAKRLRQQGIVQLRVLVGTDGRAKEIEIAATSGHESLDNAARESVARALFKPYLEGGRPRAVSVVVPIEFALT
jgi:periplasmic protein TonB